MKTFPILLVNLFLAAAGLHAEISLSPVFTDNMVLQRDQPLPVWGKAGAGDKISVAFADQSKMATADSTGNWKVLLDQQPASADPRVLSVVDEDQLPSARDRLQFTNVLVGEVWLAAGQSNMEFPLSRESHAAAEIPAATNACLRLINFTFAGQYLYGKPFDPGIIARQTAGKFFSGVWQPCSPASAKAFSAIAYYFGKELSTNLSVPVGIINCAVGGSPTEAWIRRAALASNPELRSLVAGNWLTNTALDDWCRQRGRENLAAALKSPRTLPGDDLGPDHPFKPGFLWAAGPARFAPYAVRGVIWYQGESNSLEERRERQHEILFPLLVRDWRAAWGESFPFLFCQLSSIRTNHYQSAFWPEFRDQQRRFLETVPNAGMVVTSDHGLPDDVHPREKREVGHRLALVARARVYGEQVEFSGPQPVKAVARGAAVNVIFSHAAGLKTSDETPLNGFELAGDAGIFYPAAGRVGGEELFLASPQVPSPRRVRYGWQPFSSGNLVNREGLPASTFEIPVAAQ